MSFVQNFPLFAIILSLVCAVISFAANDRWARGLTLFLLSVSVCMQAALLVFCAVNGTSYSYMMGHYPAPWGNEITVGVLESFMALLFAAVMRIFVIPHFKEIPGKLQTLLETLVGMFDNLAKSNSPHRNGFLGAYVFGAGVYIFVSTIFELLGLQVVTTTGRSMSMPAPLSDINGAIAMGCVSYLVILSGGIASNGFRGVGSTLKEFSLPISMSFRLFGAMLSGLLVTELVYYTIMLSIVLPVIVAVLFTLLHALIQTYVLTMLTSVFYGEVSEPHQKKK